MVYNKKHYQKFYQRHKEKKKEYARNYYHNKKKLNIVKESKILFNYSTSSGERYKRNDNLEDHIKKLNFVVTF